MILSAEEFLRLRTSDDPGLYRRAAHEPAPDAVWNDIVARFPEMRVWVVHNKTVPVEVLEQLSVDQDSTVRWAVAGKRKLSPALFERLAGDAEPSVRHQVARNAKAPREVLERLAADPVATVASAARRRVRTRGSE